MVELKARRFLNRVRKFDSCRGHSRGGAWVPPRPPRWSRALPAARDSPGEAGRSRSPRSTPAPRTVPPRSKALVCTAGRLDSADMLAGSAISGPWASPGGLTAAGSARDGGTRARRGFPQPPEPAPYV